ncbi:MAG: DNA-binding protein [Bacteroidetes bacterium]|nr:DNA-binding protein [Bacteroidota bacterium]
MAIKFYKYKRKITKDSVPEYKYMPKNHVEAIVGLEELAEMIEKKSSMSRGDILGVLAEVETTVCYMLENGHPVKLGILGTFYPSIETKSVDSPEEVTGKLIKRFKVIFKPSKYLKNRFKNVEFVLGDSVVRNAYYKKKN